MFYDSMTVGQALKEAVQLLARAGSSQSVQLDAQWLLMHVMGLERHHLIIYDNQPMTSQQIHHYQDLVQRRLKAEPIAYIVGSKPFMGLDFAVESGVLIPRPDTEHLVEACLTFCKGLSRVAFAEIGTGSGAICVSILHYLKEAEKEAFGVGLEISEKAIEITGQNAYSNHVQMGLELRRSDCFSALKEGERFDFIVSNPPYISKAQMAELMPDVGLFEPHLALFGGIDGLDFYRRIIEEAPSFLNEGGGLFFEIGFDQGQAVRQLMADRGFVHIEIIKDLAGHDRVVYGLMKA